MKYRSVGKSGLKVSEIAVGSWMTDLAGSEKAAIVSFSKLFGGVFVSLFGGKFRF